MKNRIKVEETAHGSLSVLHTGKDAQWCEAGEIVRLDWQPTTGWGLQEAHYTTEGGETVGIDLKTRRFAMPDTAITIGGTFKRFVLQDWTAGKDAEEGYFFAVGENGEPVAVPAPEGQSLQYVKDGPDKSVIEGAVEINEATGIHSHAEGWGTKATKYSSHAEGSGTTAQGDSSHAEGSGTTAQGNSSHAEGSGTTAQGDSSHAEGSGTTAQGNSSHAEGSGTTAYGRASHVFGEYNETQEDPGASNRGIYVEAVGGGSSKNNRKNIRTLTWGGKEKLSDTLEVGRAPQTDFEVATKKYVDDAIPQISLPLILSGMTTMNIGITEASGNLYRSNLQTIVVDEISPAEGKVFVGNVFPQKEGYPVWVSNVKTFVNEYDEVCLSFYLNSGGFRNATNYDIVWTLLECIEY